MRGPGWRCFIWACFWARRQQAAPAFGQSSVWQRWVGCCSMWCCPSASMWRPTCRTGGGSRISASAIGGGASFRCTATTLRSRQRTRLRAAGTPGCWGLRPCGTTATAVCPYGMKASIAGMAGPVIWVVGLAALVGLFWHQVSGRGSRQGRSGADPVRHAAYPMDACHALHLFVPLFSQLDVLSGGAGPCAGPYALPGLGAVAVRRPLRRGGFVLFAVYYPALSGLPHPRMVGRRIGSAAELWVLLNGKGSGRIWNPPLRLQGSASSMSRNVGGCCCKAPAIAI